MDRNRLEYLLTQYHADKATPGELGELSLYIRQNPESELFEDIVAAQLSAYEETLTGEGPSRFADIAKKALGVDKPGVYHNKGGKVIPGWAWAAASVLVLLAAGATWWKWQQPVKNQPSIVSAITEIGPGGTGAILTLANGTRIELDSLKNGVVATQSGVKIMLNNGQLTYDKLQASTELLAYNTMTTPRGRQFQLVLPDGTRVWLNAASSIRYPARFGADIRKVDLTGEAYFEVAENAKAPFRVQVAGKAEIAVLGTSFNIKAYDNEPTINTTLLNGKVKVGSSKTAIILGPGQEARVRQSDATITREENANIEKIMAWKNGIFNFDGATLEEVMKQLERWYDIEVVYEGKPSAIRFAGEMEMNIPLNDVLGMLSEMKVHSRLEAGRKLVVTP